MKARRGIGEWVRKVSKKDELHQLIDALPEGETLAAKRFLEFLLNLREGKEYFSQKDLAEIEEGFAQIRRGQYVTWEKC